MEFPVCDGSVSTGAGGELLCSGVWLGTTDGPVLTLAELSSTNIAALLSAGLVTLVIAYSLRVLRKQLGF